ncbi:hypothetical protein [Haploplasma axanthum]|uniref:Uncharacterized protein n=1 Tax=Haploplasma axanthum TaxID=29552 RepID=A0A449BBT2_HAPAX|nr:hypothetical protein [Haploplasma axanthum]VEU79889.1 Uncharacterised protein [Haploplasma axanthum]
MKLSIKEAMKMIARFENDIQELLDIERRESFIIYLANEEVTKTDYIFDKANSNLDLYQEQIRQIKNAINKANLTTKTDYKDLVISEALILLAQKNNNQIRLNELASYKQVTRKTSYEGIIEYNERLYDINIVRELLKQNTEDIHKLQTAIDKANILTEIEI